MMHAGRILLTIAAAAIFAGCAHYRPPHLDVAHIRLVDETPDGLVLNFDLDARNDNEIELPLREVRYTVSLDGHSVFSGTRSPEANLRRLGTQRIIFPAAIAIDGRERPAGLVRYTVEGELHYITPGDIARILFDLHILRPRIRFKDEGMVDLGEPAQAASAP